MFQGQLNYDQHVAVSYTSAPVTTRVSRVKKEKEKSDKAGAESKAKK